MFPTLSQPVWLCCMHCVRMRKEYDDDDDDDDDDGGIDIDDNLLQSTPTLYNWRRRDPLARPIIRRLHSAGISSEQPTFA